MGAIKKELREGTWGPTGFVPATPAVPRVYNCSHHLEILNAFPFEPVPVRKQDSGAQAGITASVPGAECTRPGSTCAEPQGDTERTEL